MHRKRVLFNNLIGMVCTGLCEWLDEEQVVMKAAGFLQAWLRDGWIADVEVNC
jgi:hypothetical protein